MNYESMSDANINSAMTEIIYGLSEWNYDELSKSFIHEDGTVIPSEDYCNNPADMWPIIVANKIETGWYCGDKWRAVIDNQFKAGDFKSIAYCHDNPLRAAAIVFLMMQDAK
jgi:hypothetical protein